MREQRAASELRPRPGLRRTLLLILLPCMLAVAAAESWLAWRTAVDAADAAYDRSLFGAIKAIDANISTESGGIGVELPYRLLEFFELTASGNVYFRIATEDGLVELGNTDLPPPPTPLPTGRPRFADATYVGERVRIGSYARPIATPGAVAGGGSRIVIQVAESVASRNEFTRALVIEAISRDLLLIGFGAALLTALVTWALMPLRRLRREVLARAPDDLTPIESANVPRDVAPLVDAINHHVLKSRELAEQRRRFVDDASHQLRTPLATLATQMTYALRERDPQRVMEALPAIKLQLDETVHRTNQMLALARADTATSEVGRVELNALAEALTRERWNEARDKGIDLGLDAPTSLVVIRGHDALLREALRNLLDNALKYTPQGGHVTVRVGRANDEGVVAVVDDGPGIPPGERARAGERFFRGSNVTAAGSGLGLAIVRSVAERSGGRMHVGAGPDDRGCAVAIHLPLWPAGTPDR